MPNNTTYVILGLLTEAPLSGYAIKKLVDVRFRFFWSESYGQIYPELKRLVRGGYVRECDESGTAGQRGKRVFALTDAGRVALVRWLGEPAAKETVRLELLLKMYFSSLVPRAAMVSNVERFADEHAKDAAILEMFKHELESIPDDHGNHADILRVIDFGIRANQAYLEWSRATMSYLKGARPHETENA